MKELYLSAIIAEQRCESSPYANIEFCIRIVRIRLEEIIFLFFRDHLEAKLIVITQEECPLTVGRSRWRLLHDVDDRITVFRTQRKEQSRHQRIVEVHMTLVIVSEVCCSIFRPKVRFSHQYFVL